MKLHTFIPGILNPAYMMHESSGGLLSLNRWHSLDVGCCVHWQKMPVDEPCEDSVCMERPLRWRLR